jgi:hypothetical protein
VGHDPLGIHGVGASWSNIANAIAVITETTRYDEDAKKKSSGTVGLIQ